MVIDTKEKTAFATSVGADERQSVQNTNNSIPTSDAEINDLNENSSENLEEMYRQMQRMSHPYYLHTVSMTELYQTSYKSRPPIIDGLLYSGAYILAGAPKIGKSFLVAQIAYHVSTGVKLWDYEVHQGSVLYLALEDDYQRIQSRMFMMYGVEDSDRLHFATAANKIGNGLDEQLDFFIGEHTDTKLIIIDTMQKIREVGGEAYSYASDYEIIGRLKQFADRHCICVLIVHHTRKQPSGDMKEQERLSELQETRTAMQAEIVDLQEAQAKEAEQLDKTKERIQKQKLDLKRIDEIEAKPTLIGNKVTVDKEDFDMVITAAKKHVTQEKKESKLQKALDAAHKLIAELRSTIADLKNQLSATRRELAELKSVRGQLRTAELEKENDRLRNKVRTYEEGISRNNLWDLFRPIRTKKRNLDDAR